MNYSRKKIALLMSALIIGQAMTMQNMQGMDIFSGDNTEDNANMMYDFYADTFSYLKNPVVSFYRNTLYAGSVNLCNKLTSLYNQASDTANEYGPIVEAELQEKANLVKDECAELYNAITAENQYRTRPGFRLIPGIGLCDALSDGTKTLYNYDYNALYDNASAQGHALYNQASDKATTVKNGIVAGTEALYNYDYNAFYDNASTQEHALYNQASDKATTIKNGVSDGATALYDNVSTQGRNLYNQASDKVTTVKNRVNTGATTLYNNVSNWCTNDAPHFLNNLREASNKDFWVRAKNHAIQGTNNTIQYIKNIPNRIECAAEDYVVHKATNRLENIARDQFGLDPNAPVDADVIKREVRNHLANETKDLARDQLRLDPNAPVDADVVMDAIAKKALFSLTKYAAVVAAGLFTTYKAYTYCVNKYQEYQKAHALDESIKQHLTDEKKAEIAQLTGKELSNDDLQEIINNIKTQATTAEDGRATQAIVDLAIKEYVNKQANV